MAIKVLPTKKNKNQFPCFSLSVRNVMLIECYLFISKIKS